MSAGGPGTRNHGPLYSAPLAIWFTLFFLGPIIIILVYSFLKKGLYGGVVWEFSFEAYRGLGNPNFTVITARTLFTSVIATVITILIALPCGYFMARSRNQTTLLLLIIIPFWTNFLIRVFAWMNILGNNGFLNELLTRFGLIRGDYIHFLYNQKAVILVLVYMYLPYAILPLFSTIDKFDFSLLEAARDLGATQPAAIVKVLLPNIRSGIFTAVLFTFIPIFGAYAVPLLVGGNSYMLGNVIVDQLIKSRNWPLASAISMSLTVITTFGVLVMIHIQKKDALRIADAKDGKGAFH